MNATLERIVTGIAQRGLLACAQTGGIRHQLASKRYPSAPPPDGRWVQLGVVQLEGRLCARVADYVEQVYQLTRRAVEDGAQLVIFPEDTGSYPLAGLIPGIERLASGGKGEPASEAVRGGSAPVLLLFRILAPAASQVHHATFSTLARSCGAYILAGSTLALDGAGHVYKEARLYGPDGALLMTQRKTHLFPTEALWGMSRDELIHVIKTPLGALASPICMDHTYFEPIRVAWLQGAEIIIDPAADAARYEFWAQMRGVWARVQESPAYGVHVLMVGNILGNEFGGRSGVYAPLALSPNGDGVLAQAATGDAEEVFCATVDLEALRAYRRDHAPDFNLELYRRYTPVAYMQARVHGGRVVA
jgi:predicted amidohydrolase